ncbi:MAG: hydrogenase nickel incorporation protein HypB [Mariprofundaceae bacterium]
MEMDLMDQNRVYAEKNRTYFNTHHMFTLNMVSSPGSGKTTLLVSMIKALVGQVEVNVIEGDQQTSLDADRITEAGANAHQINTGQMCHLDAHMVGHAVEHLAPTDGSFLFIENVGNLICPAAFDLGEQKRVALLSVTEGEDKPLKYPDMFASASVVVINKCDLLPYVDFDLDQCRENIRRINPGADIIELSATTGNGMDMWLEWLNSERDRYRTAVVEQGAED